MNTQNLALALVLLTATNADAQRRRPPRDDGGQTPRTVEESILEQERKKEERKEEFFGWWESELKRHYKNQDKATRKRMRQNARRQKRVQQGRQVPWWRRIFGRPNRYR